MPGPRPAGKPEESPRDGAVPWPCSPAAGKEPLRPEPRRPEPRPGAQRETKSRPAAAQRASSVFVSAQWRPEYGCCRAPRVSSLSGSLPGTDKAPGCPSPALPEPFGKAAKVQERPGAPQEHPAPIASHSSLAWGGGCRGLCRSPEEGLWPSGAGGAPPEPPPRRKPPQWAIARNSQQKTSGNVPPVPRSL